MKTFTSLLALIGILAVAGCSSPRGGTADDYDYNTGSYHSDNVPSTVTPNVPPMDDTLPQNDNPSINSSGASAVPPVPPP